MTPSIRTYPSVTKTRLSRRCFVNTGLLATVGAVCDRAFPRAFAATLQVGPQISVTDLGGLFLFQGAGCNVVAMHGEDGALMIDGGLAANADALLKSVKERTGNSRINTLINTHWHPAQTGANEAVGRDGGVIIAQEKTAMYLSNTVMTSVAFEGRLAPLPKVARPTKTIRQDLSLQFAGQQVDCAYLPSAHTDGDLYIHFPEKNLLVAGGVASGERWPLLDYRNGAWFGGRVRAFERLAKLVRPDTRVIPAEGRLITGADIARVNDIYQKLNIEMFAYMNMGLGPEDVAARNPLKQYQAEFGDASAFLYGAYRSMLIAYVPD